MTAKQRIFKRLLQGQAALYELMKPEIGGLRAHARIGELRKEGVEIDFYRRTNSAGKKTKKSSAPKPW